MGVSELLLHVYLLTAFKVAPCLTIVLHTFEIVEVTVVIDS